MMSQAAPESAGPQHRPAGPDLRDPLGELVRAIVDLSTLLPRAISDAIRFAIVWLFPVPGGPLTIRLCPPSTALICIVLARIGIQHQELISKRHLIRPRNRPRPGPWLRIRCAGLLITRQCRDQIVRGQLHLAALSRSLTIASLA